MTQSSAITIPDASTLAVDTSCIDCSEVENQEDAQLLHELGAEILTVKLQAEETIRKVVALIYQRASLRIGEKVAKIQDHPRLGKYGKLQKFYDSIQLNRATANNWAQAWRTSDELDQKCGDLLAEDDVLNLPGDRVLTRIQAALPEDAKEFFLARIAVGEEITQAMVEAEAKKPEVKKTKAEEMLARMQAKKVKAETELEAVPPGQKTDSNPEYKNAKAGVSNAERSISHYEQQIADLEAQIEEEKLKTAEEAEAKAVAEAQTASVEKELQKLKFDDAKVRSERVKKLSTTLTVSLPQALADVSKFFAEIDSYPEETRKHIYNTAKSLANEIADKL